MKLGLLAAMILLTGCVPPRPYPPAPAGSRSAPASSFPDAETGSTNTFNRDAYECEREAAMSGVAGGKAEVFNNCMRARGHTAGR